MLKASFGIFILRQLCLDAADGKAEFLRVCTLHLHQHIALRSKLGQDQESRLAKGL